MGSICERDFLFRNITHVFVYHSKTDLTTAIETHHKLHYTTVYDITNKDTGRINIF